MVVKVAVEAVKTSPPGCRSVLAEKNFHPPNGGLELPLPFDVPAPSSSHYPTMLLPIAPSTDNPPLPVAPNTANPPPTTRRRHQQYLPTTPSIPNVFHHPPTVPMTPPSCSPISPTATHPSHSRSNNNSTAKKSPHTSYYAP